MADEKISALASGSPILDTDEFIIARSGDNKKVTGANIRTYNTTPINIAIGDVATATDLIDGQLYNVTGLPVFTSGVQLNDLRFYAYKDTPNIGAVPAVMSPYGTANYSSLGSARTCEITIDWYGTGNVEFVRDIAAKNEIAGFSNIDIFPFQTGSSDRNGNKVGSGFTLDITSLTTEKFNNNTCYGNGTYTAIAGRDYEGIDFTKKYFAYDFLISCAGSTGDNITLTEITNELGEVPTPTFIIDGEYRIDGTLAGVFGASVSKCSVIPAPSDISTTFTSVFVKYNSDTRIDVQFNDISGSGHVVANIVDLQVQVKVYF